MNDNIIEWEQARLLGTHTARKYAYISPKFTLKEREKIDYSEEHQHL